MGRFPESILNADARYRVAEFSQGTERLKWYEYALRQGPDSQFFERGLTDYIDAATALGFTWRAASTCQDLSAELTDPAKLAAVRLQNARLHEEKLDRPELALPLYDRVSDASPRLGPWAEAQHRAGLIEFAQKDYAKALDRFTRLRQERPEYRWVQTGECLYYIGRCNESLANWDQALKAYLELINQHRDSSRVTSGRLLLEIFGRVDEANRLKLYEKHPEDIRKVLPRLDAWEREKLLRLIPELRT
jgi:tetratricopeptide (TPR) repeat protein